jgi:anti-sigma B factor antagonist
MSELRMELVKIIPAAGSPLRDDQSSLPVFTTMIGDVPVTVVTGAVDRISHPQLQAEISAQLRARPRVLVLDLTKVSLFGSVGVRLLINSHHEASENSSRLVVVTGARVSHVLAWTTADSLLEMYSDILTAMRSL